MSSLLEQASLVVTPNGTKESKLYSVKPTDGSGDMTVVRATTATRVNSSGLIESVATNVPRLDYTDSTCPSILVEPQRTNLALRSEEFDNASWSKVSCSITANATTAPNGTTTADLLTSDNIGSFGIIQQTLSANGTITFSLFVKQNTANLVTLYLTGTGIGAELGANLIYDFNFTTNTLVKNASSSSTATTTQVENFDNNWKRISVTVSSTTITDVRVYSNWNTINNFSTYIWGSQLEAGANATSYIPTTTASVTRNADVISKTGISSLIGQTEGTLFVDASKIGLETSEFYISDGTYDNIIKFQYYESGNTIFAVVVIGGVTQCLLSSSGYTVSDFLKIAIKYKSNSFALWINGTEVSTDTSGSTFAANTLNRINFGQPDNNSAGVFKANIKSLIIWKTALTNTELATLTTL